MCVNLKFLQLKNFTVFSQIKNFTELHSISLYIGILWPCVIRWDQKTWHALNFIKCIVADLTWHNLKSLYPTLVKVYIFKKLFLQGIQKLHYLYVGRDKLESVMAQQNDIFEGKSGSFLQSQICILQAYTHSYI